MDNIASVQPKEQRYSKGNLKKANNGSFPLKVANLLRAMKVPPQEKFGQAAENHVVERQHIHLKSRFMEKQGGIQVCQYIVKSVFVCISFMS